MAAAILNAPEGGFLIAGTTASFGGGNTDAYLVRIDAQGEELWSKTHASLCIQIQNPRATVARCIWSVCPSTSRSLSTM